MNRADLLQIYFIFENYKFIWPQLWVNYTYDGNAMRLDKDILYVEITFLDATSRDLFNQFTRDCLKDYPHPLNSDKFKERFAFSADTSVGNDKEKSKENWAKLKMLDTQLDLLKEKTINLRYEQIKTLLRQYLPSDVIISNTKPIINVTFTTERHHKNFCNVFNGHCIDLSFINKCSVVDFEQYTQQLSEKLKRIQDNNAMTWNESDRIKESFNTCATTVPFALNIQESSTDHSMIITIDCTTDEQVEALKKHFLEKLQHNQYTVNERNITLAIKQEEEELSSQSISDAFQKINMELSPTLHDSIGFNIINAIKAGLSDHTTYPVATIKIDGQGRQFFCITAELESQATDWFDHLMDAFPRLCEREQINKFPNKSVYAERAVLPKSTGKSLVKYEFYISPLELDKLLLESSPYYLGYRGGSSILTLLEPSKPLLKPNVMCLFPVFIDAESMLIRNAGCNFSDTIASQLSFHIREHLPKYASTLTQDCYGHHITPLLQALNITPEELVNAAFLCAHVPMDSRGFSHQMDYQNAFKLTSEAKSHVQSMDHEALNIYRSLSAVTFDELQHLQSFEVPLTSYLERLMEVIPKEQHQTHAILTELHQKLHINAEAVDLEDEPSQNRLT